AAWAYRFSSQVSLYYPRALLFEIESSLGLFGPWPQLEARLRKELTELGFRHRIVAAPNPAAARILANGYDGLAVADDS
ncbi:DNA polymerase Y family protein, partial [Pseudomonas sp. SIMBA_064]